MTVSDPAPVDPVVAALVAELGKKTSVCWLTYVATPDTPAGTHAAWHEWLDTGDGGSLYVVAGGTEQPLPGLARAGRVEVTMRSKDNGGRLVTWEATPSQVLPEDDAWVAVTAALAAGRLNVPDLGAAAEGWASGSVVTRLEPTGRTVERPDDLSAEHHRATPPDSPATTRGPLPRVLHRRVRRRPRLS